jgi:NTP pyrophosphatase (non-canonical NTP hydrolase)
MSKALTPKPCPFCGDTPLQEDWQDGRTAILCYKKACPSNPYVVAIGPARAILKWNTRSLQPDTVDTLIHPIWMDWISRRASKNLAKWGVQDFETLGLAVAEEAGELAQAILQNKHEKGELGRISQEAIDLGALCVQVLVTMSERHGVDNVWNALFSDESNAPAAQMDVTIISQSFDEKTSTGVTP